MTSITKIYRYNTPGFQLFGYRTKRSFSLRPFVNQRIFIGNSLGVREQGRAFKVVRVRRFTPLSPSGIA